MIYVSSRGAAPPADFAQVLLSGLAPDGGLYIPQAWPRFTAAEIAAFAGRPYAEVAAAVLGRFVGDSLPEAVVREATASAYAGFGHPAVVPLKQFDRDLWLLELFHGPTLAFKDVAMQLLARLYDAVLAGTGRTLTIVCATSGDTGGAAVEAFRGSAHVRIVVLFPEGRISEVQRRFMTTTRDDNVRTVAVEGTFDDCQALVKALFADAAFRTEVDLSGVNSINWARIAAQSVYYLTAAVALGAPHRSVNFAVPTGNFGDAFAGYVAERMGAPIDRMVVATNSNDILARALATGRYETGAVTATQSPAMDIQVASNFERLLYESLDQDGGETARLFDRFARSGALEIPPAALAAMQARFQGVSVGEEETTRSIADAYAETGELIDPHTAVGFAAARQVSTPGNAPLVVLSTAHPAKFPEAVAAATGLDPVPHPRAAHLGALDERIDRLAADVGALKDYVRRFAKR